MLPHLRSVFLVTQRQQHCDFGWPSSCPIWFALFKSLAGVRQGPSSSFLLIFNAHGWRRWAASPRTAGKKGSYHRAGGLVESWPEHHLTRRGHLRRLVQRPSLHRHEPATAETPSASMPTFSPWPREPPTLLLLSFPRWQRSPSPSSTLLSCVGPSPAALHLCTKPPAAAPSRARSKMASAQCWGRLPSASRLRSGPGRLASLHVSLWIEAADDEDMARIRGALGRRAPDEARGGPHALSCGNNSAHPWPRGRGPADDRNATAPGRHRTGLHQCSQGSAKDVTGPPFHRAPSASQARIASSSGVADAGLHAVASCSYTFSPWCRRQAAGAPPKETCPLAMSSAQSCA